MKTDLHTKVQAMLWDRPLTKRLELAEKILADPGDFFHHDEQLFIEALNTFSWYELTRLINAKCLLPTLRKVVRC